MNLMFNFCKVTSLVCAVSDGLKLKKYGYDKTDLKSREKLYANEDGIPNFFDYWAYMYFCGAAISGPWYEFKDFQQYMKGKEHYKDIPSTVSQTFFRVFNIVILIVTQTILSSQFSAEYLLT